MIQICNKCAAPSPHGFNQNGECYACATSCVRCGLAPMHYTNGLCSNCYGQAHNPVPAPPPAPAAYRCNGCQATFNSPLSSAGLCYGCSRLGVPAPPPAPRCGAKGCQNPVQPGRIYCGACLNHKPAPLNQRGSHNGGAWLDDNQKQLNATSMHHAAPLKWSGFKPGDKLKDVKCVKCKNTGKITIVSATEALCKLCGKEYKQ